jgi:copper(I)-binding protein
VPFLLGGLLVACSAETPELHAPGQHAATGGMQITDAWARATPPAATVGAAYFTVTNHTATADTLLSVISPLAGRVELHRTVTEDGMARMRPADAIEIPAGTSLQAEPGDLHVMLVDLRQPLAEGAALPLELTFRTAGKLAVQATILPLTATGAPDQTEHTEHADHAGH